MTMSVVDHCACEL